MGENRTAWTFEKVGIGRGVETVLEHATFKGSRRKVATAPVCYAETAGRGALGRAVIRYVDTRGWCIGWFRRHAAEGAG
jgi:hypothetical protein